MPPMFEEEDDAPEIVEIDDSEDELVVLSSSPVNHESQPTLSQTLRRKAESAKTAHEDGKAPRLHQRRSYTPTVDGEDSDESEVEDGSNDKSLPDSDDGYSTDTKDAVDNDNDDFVLPACSQKIGSVEVEFPTSTLICPRSVSLNYEPDMPISRESDAVRALSNLVWRSQKDRLHSDRKHDDDWIDFELEQFEIYNTSKHSQWRLRALNFLRGVQQNHDTMYFDGVLSFSGVRHYVQRVPFSELQVGGYGLGGGAGTVREQLWMRSKLNENTNVYYRLRQPSAVYARFFSPFLWVADLGKHFVDFCENMEDNGRRVRLSHFRSRFSSWLNKAYPESQFPEVRKWRRQFGRSDFRVAIVTHSDYLWKEIADLDQKLAHSLPVFEELRLSPPTEANKKATTSSPPPTVVTPYVYKSFASLAIHKYLRSMPGINASPNLGNSTIFAQRHSPFTTGPDTSLSLSDKLRNIQPGDVVSTMMDRDGFWDNAKEKKECWYGLVHRINVPRQAYKPRVFDVAWLYSPEHTPCRQTGYPWPKELFLSTHCGCLDKGFNEIREDEVLGIHSVEWFGGPETSADFFVRQTYISSERRWIHLEMAHVFCDASRSEVPLSLFRDRIGPADVDTDIRHQYAVGDTVLATTSRYSSEPFEIHSMHHNDGQNLIRLRKLLRRKVVDRDAGDAAPNELVYTDQFVTLKMRRVMGRCTVRVFSPDSEIPAPYNREGTGNFFFITHKQMSNIVGSDLDIDSTVKEADHSVYVPLEPHERLSMRQGFDPDAPCPKLRSLDLFCGCGNLGRGLEDSGAIESRWANDIWDRATKTFMANVTSSHPVEAFLGSADIFLEKALQGEYSQQIPAPGDVDLISGGSPCQGFSKLTVDRMNHGQFKNRSMIASFASFIDFYRPKYGILENVPDLIVNDGHDDKKPQNEDIFGGLVGCLVGLGYQLTTVLGNAWSFGAPQRRQRVFLLFAAPGVQLPEPPLPSHSEPPDFWGHKSAGSLPNGERICGTDDAEDNPATAFSFVSAAKATADLRKGAADMIDGMVDICVPHPDHRLSSILTDNLRLKIANIPTRPHGMNLGKARKLGAISDAAVKLFSDSQQKQGVKSVAFTRLMPTELFSTVRTCCNVGDARSGKVMHWKDPRPLSIMEVRRAQGIPDHEVLLGSPADKWKLVGNAVARQPALAIGLAIREAWLGTLCDEGGPAPASAEAAVSLTTTTTTTLTTTLTTTTTMTISAETNPSSPGPAKMVSPPPPSKLPLSTNLPFQENRTFKTSVQTTVVSRAGQAASASPEHPRAASDALSDTDEWRGVSPLALRTASLSPNHKRRRSISSSGLGSASKHVCPEDKLTSDDYIVID